MNLQTAIAAAMQSGDWLRPVSHRGSGMAYLVEDGFMCSVPTPRGSVPSMTYHVADLVCKWEVISPDVVIAERESMMEETT
jgi:hypothetical protein